MNSNEYLSIPITVQFDESDIYIGMLDRKFLKSRVERAASPEQLELVARQIEALLGHLESYGLDVDALDHHWDVFCTELMAKARKLGIRPPRGDFKADFQHRQVLDAIQLAMSVASYDHNPVVANWAYSKAEDFGDVDEIAGLRLLLWAGYPATFASPDSRFTALHHMAFFKAHDASHPRAVRLLLKAGANPNATNFYDDTPLAYMCGATPCSEMMHQTAELLFAAGADWNIKAKDGKSARNLIEDGEWPQEDKDRMVEAALNPGKQDDAAESNDEEVSK